MSLYWSLSCVCCLSRQLGLEEFPVTLQSTCHCVSQCHSIIVTVPCRAPVCMHCMQRQLGLEEFSVHLTSDEGAAALAGKDAARLATAVPG